MSKVIVTGGGGFIGAYLVRKLVSLSYSVVVVDNMTRGVPERLEGVENAIELLNVDVCNTNSLVEAFTNAEVVIHLAAVNGTDNFYKRPQLVLDVGVRGALSVMTAAREAEVKHVIFASSAEVYQTPSIVPTPEDIPLLIPDSLNPRYSYGGSKLISELIAFNYHAEFFEKVQVFRPHNIYGPDMGFKHVIPQFILKAFDVLDGRSDSFDIIGSGKETRAFCYVDDVVDGIITMMEAGGNREIYHIGNDTEVAISDIAERVLNLVGVKSLITSKPGHEGATPRRCPDITKMRSLGYSPKVDLQQGLEATIQWYSKHRENSTGNQLL
jgi:UDP-glucose 4-epimerase